MNVDQGKSSDLIVALEKAFIETAMFADRLLGLASFVDRRYLSDQSSRSSYLRAELADTVTEIGSLISLLAGSVAMWKKGNRRLLSRSGLETNVLDELFVNLQAVIYLLTSYEVDVESAEPEDGFRALYQLKLLNARLP